MPRLLFAFDFDHTIVEENTDLVVQTIPDKSEAKAVRDSDDKTDWTAFMDRVFGVHHENGVTREDYEKILDSLEFVPGMENLLQDLRSKFDCEIIIISDANSFFISRILERAKLDSLIAETFTNPAEFEESGRLRVRPFHCNTDCDLSGKNLCKGRVLEEYLEKRRGQGVEFENVLYAGDGGNDFCPMLRLCSRDGAFPRVGFFLEKYVNRMAKKKENPLRIPAMKYFWNDGHDILRVMNKVFQQQKQSSS